METEAARYRSAETRHGGPVRWFIDQLEAGRTKMEASVGAVLDKASNWPEALVNGTRVVTVKKRAHYAMQQAELWPREGAVIAGNEYPDSRIMPVDEKRDAAPAPVPVIEVKRLRAPGSRKIQAAVRRPAAPVTAPVAHLHPAGNMARFLNVNGAIERMQTGEIRFDLPRRSFSKTLRLWKGTAENSEYTPVYF